MSILRLIEKIAKGSFFRKYLTIKSTLGNMKHDRTLPNTMAPAVGPNLSFGHVFYTTNFVQL